MNFVNNRLPARLHQLALSAGVALLLSHGSAVGGTVTGGGAGSKWNNSNTLKLGEGFNSTATLNIDPGGVVTNTIGRIALGESSTATVNVDGGQWINSSFLEVGPNGADE